MSFDAVPFGAPFMDRGKVPHSAGAAQRQQEARFGYEEANGTVKLVQTNAGR